MYLSLRHLFIVLVACVLTANQSLGQPLLDDNFDDNDPLVNANGVGGGVNPTVAGIGTEADDIFSLSLTNGASRSGILSQAEYTGNAATPLIGTFTYTEMIRPLVDGASVNGGTSRWAAGFLSDTADTDDDDFDSFSNVGGGGAADGLFVAFKEREDNVGRALNGDEGTLYYNGVDGSSTVLASWTWDRTLFSFDEAAIDAGLRSDRISQDLLVDLKVELSSDSTGYGLRFFSSDDNVVLPADISGTWAAAGISDLSALDTVHAVPFGGQNGNNTLIEIDRLYVDDEPERNADASGQLFTWGARPTTDGSWGADPGWQVGGADTANIPDVVTATRSADSVQVLAGTVRVDTADQGAWTLQVDSGATAEVASGFTLDVIENVSDSAVNVAAGGNLVIGGTVITPSVGGSGSVTFADGTLRIDHGAIGSVTTTSDGTISNARDVSVGQVTLGAGDTLIKQRAGTLLLDQSGGANSLAATSTVEAQFGSVAGLNDGSNNAFGSADINVNGGGVTLSASAPSSAAYDNPVTVNTSGTICAAQVAGGLANETVTLGGSNGVTVAAGQTATLDTADGYTMNVAGAVSGGGTLSVADGASVGLNGGVSSAVAEFRGNVNNVFRRRQLVADRLISVCTDGRHSEHGRWL